MAADVLAGLIAGLPGGMVVTDPAVTESYRQDRALDPSAGSRRPWCVRGVPKRSRPSCDGPALTGFRW